MLQVVPATLQRHGVDRPCTPVTRQNAGLAHPQEVDEVPLAHRQQQRPEVDVLSLGYPQALVEVEVEDTGDYQVLELAVGLLAAVRDRLLNL